MSIHFLHDWDLCPPAIAVEILLEKLSVDMIIDDSDASAEAANVPHSLPVCEAKILTDFVKSVYCQPSKLFSISFALVSKLIGNGEC